MSFERSTPPNRVAIEAVLTGEERRVLSVACSEAGVPRERWPEVKAWARYWGEVAGRRMLKELVASGMGREDAFREVEVLLGIPPSTLRGYLGATARTGQDVAA
ncbi:MAG TPA: hypothetical protein VML95_02120 [Longimicrobiales bacterium]|nr:hypothetical protein [Longimicrobiales bacterium]